MWYEARAHSIWRDLAITEVPGRSLPEPQIAALKQLSLLALREAEVMTFNDFGAQQIADPFDQVIEVRFAHAVLSPCGFLSTCHYRDYLPVM